MKKYDGWTIKFFFSDGQSNLITGFFHRIRSEVIKDFERIWGKGDWRKTRRKGSFKIVKVKLVEVK